MSELILQDVFQYLGTLVPVSRTSLLVSEEPLEMIILKLKDMPKTFIMGLEGSSRRSQKAC